MRVGGVLAALLTAVYLATGVPAHAPGPGYVSAHPQPVRHAVVLGEKLSHPPPRVSVRASTAAPRKRATACVVGQPCNLAGVRWSKTVGCTRTWLQNQRRTDPRAQCPPGWPLLP